MLDLKIMIAKNKINVLLSGILALLYSSACGQEKITTPMESLSPNLFVADVNKSVAFYNILGFHKIASVPEQGQYDWAMVVSGNVTIMFQTVESLKDELPEIKRQIGGSLLLYIKIKDIHAFYSLVKEKVTVLKAPEKTFYGAIEFTIKDLDGYVIVFAEDE